jgi:hypothetical protein
MFRNRQSRLVRGPWSCLLLTALPLAGCARVSELLGVLVTDAGAQGASSEAQVADADGNADSLLASDAGDVEAGVIQTAADAEAGDSPEASALGQGPFGPVSLVTGVSNAAWVNEDPSLTGDQLELYFASQQTGTTAIWVSRRATVTAAWGASQLLSELGSPANEPCISRDGLTIWFARPGSSDAALSSHIWVASRVATTVAWGAAQLVMELAASGFDDEKPSVDDAALVMVFMSNRRGGAGGMDLYMSTRPTQSAPWGAPANLTEVNTAGDERDPFIGGQDLQLFWAANPPMEQIRSATRTSVTQRFSAFQPLSELGGPDLDPALSVDLRHILFASQRAGDQHQQIYQAFR